jgi:hypothetical protein
MGGAKARVRIGVYNTCVEDERSKIGKGENIFTYIINIGENIFTLARDVKIRPVNVVCAHGSDRGDMGKKSAFKGALA